MFLFCINFIMLNNKGNSCFIISFALIIIFIPAQEASWCLCHYYIIIYIIFYYNSFLCLLVFSPGDNRHDSGSAVTPKLRDSPQSQRFYIWIRLVLGSAMLLHLCASIIICQVLFSPALSFPKTADKPEERKRSITDYKLLPNQRETNSRNNHSNFRYSSTITDLLLFC